MDRTPPRRGTDAGATPPTRPRGGRFDYRLVDLAGTEVGAVRRHQALRAEDVVVVPSERGEETWRIVAVIGTSATVVPVPR
jgi:hypothetical protein